MSLWSVEGKAWQMVQRCLWNDRGKVETVRESEFSNGGDEHQGGRRRLRVAGDAGREDRVWRSEG